MATTRLGQAGIGTAAYGAFAPKDSAGGRSVGILTRLTVAGVMGAKYGTFEPKAAGAPTVNEWLIQARRRGRR